MRRATAEEVVAEKNQEIDALNAEVRKARLHAVRERAQMTHERDEAERKREVAERSLAALEQRERERQCRRLRWAFRAARVAHLLCALTIVFGVTAMFVFMQPMMVNWLNVRLGTGFKGDNLISAAIFGGITALALGWDVPDVLFGSLRERVTTCTYRWAATKLSVRHLINDFDVDFRRGTFTERHDVPGRVP